MSYVAPRVVACVLSLERASPCARVLPLCAACRGMPRALLLARRVLVAPLRRSAGWAAFLATLVLTATAVLPAYAGVHLLPHCLVAPLRHSAGWAAFLAPLVLPAYACVRSLPRRSTSCTVQLVGVCASVLTCDCALRRGVRWDPLLSFRAFQRCIALRSGWSLLVYSPVVSPPLLLVRCHLSLYLARSWCRSTPTRCSQREQRLSEDRPRMGRRRLPW